MVSCRGGVWGSNFFWIWEPQVVYSNVILPQYPYSQPLKKSLQIYTDLMNGPGSWKKKSEIRLKSDDSVPWYQCTALKLSYYPLLTLGRGKQSVHILLLQTIDQLYQPLPVHSP